jgi:hypothetical protein
MNSIDLAALETVTGGAAPVTADNFMPRAKALQTLNNQNDAHPSAALGKQIHDEFCGSLYPYAKSGKPINGFGSSIARPLVISNGDKVCK